MTCSFGHTPPPRAARRLGRRAFSFVEILFAVMILGVGFIMVAAMFPVALRQTQLSNDETMASHEAKGAVEVMGDISQLVNPQAPQATAAPGAPPIPPVTYLPPTNDPWRTDPSLTNYQPAGLMVAGSYFWNAERSDQVLWENDFWNAMRGNLILPSDRRYGWVPLYRRDLNSPYAQIILIAVQNRNRPAYDGADVTRVTTPANALKYAPTLQAKPVQVQITPGTSGAADTVKFTAVGSFFTLSAFRSGTTPAPQPMSAPPGPGTWKAPFLPADTPDYTSAVAEGCYLVLGGDPFQAGIAQTAPYPPPPASSNGSIFRVGNALPASQQPNANAPTIWELLPGNDTKGSSYVPPANKNQVTLAYIVGKGYSDITRPDKGFSGPAQDVAIYTTFVKVQ